MTLNYLSTDNDNKLKPFPTESLADPENHEERKEDEGKLVPFIKSPFHVTSIESANRATPYPIPERVGWTGILLELSMTTALNNLAEHTSILSGSAAVSFATLFPLIWWVWTSQVAYSMHFQKNDWFHRIVAFLYLLIFGALAAFTSDFDIEAGLSQTKNNDTLISPFHPILSAIELRDWPLRPPEVYLSYSRSVGSFSGKGAFRFDVFASVLLDSRKTFPSLQVGLYRHLRALTFSSACYFTAFGVMLAAHWQPEDISANYAKVYQAIAIVLWYLPLVAEISIHYINSDLIDHTKYSSKIIYERASVFFTVILGASLDNMTGGLRFLVGGLDVTSHNVGWAFCGALVIVGEFSLYFDANYETFIHNNRRLLTWYFLHSIFLLCLMMTILSTTLLIQHSNVSQAAKDIITLFGNVFNSTSTFPLSASEFPQQRDAFERLGLPLKFVLEDFNTAAANLSVSSQNLLYYQYLVLAMAIAYQEFEAYPEPNDPVAMQIDGFMSLDIGNATQMDRGNFTDIVRNLAKSHAHEVDWFIGVAGGTILMLVVLNLVKKWPKTKFHWARLISMVFSGSAFILGSFSNIGRNPRHSQHSVQDISGSETLFPPTPIQSYTNLNWIVPTFAALLMVQAGFNLTLRRFARRKAVHHTGPRTMLHLPGFETTLPTRSPEELPSANIPVSLPGLSGKLSGEFETLKAQLPTYGRSARRSFKSFWGWLRLKLSMTSRD
ncbi:hypothetical protein SISNIDRAFT_490006 [Sistotremastrum niveocremeum HHB9708]|uniref:Uncharacterized protein n=1 Tax=Sistotremastrum niveocremeum HHB9708 TaxID=1314777 RepID=A0A164PC80_9AGAM|nr:hypothetical protein SISNIDRAFT_490006 [Sistotremastrum niveocremeum HHB9708]